MSFFCSFVTVFLLSRNLSNGMKPCLSNTNTEVNSLRNSLANQSGFRDRGIAEHRGLQPIWCHYVDSLSFHRNSDQVLLPAVKASAPGPARADCREQEKIPFVNVAVAVHLVQQQRD